MGKNAVFSESNGLTYVWRVKMTSVMLYSTTQDDRCGKSTVIAASSRSEAIETALQLIKDVEGSAERLVAADIDYDDGKKIMFHIVYGHEFWFPIVYHTAVVFDPHLQMVPQNRGGLEIDFYLSIQKVQLREGHINWSDRFGFWYAPKKA